MNKLSFNVELLFADPITKEGHIKEVAKNIVTAIRYYANVSYIAPEGETHTLEVKITSKELNEAGFSVQSPII